LHTRRRDREGGAAARARVPGGRRLDSKASATFTSASPGEIIACRGKCYPSTAVRMTKTERVTLWPTASFPRWCSGDAWCSPATSASRGREDAPDVRPGGLELVTQGADSHWFHPGWYMYLHGGLFDALCVAAQRAWPGDIWTTRHCVNALFGWPRRRLRGRLGRLAGGHGAGSSRWRCSFSRRATSADSMNNPKDAPFAALFAMALYYTRGCTPGSRSSTCGCSSPWRRRSRSPSMSRGALLLLGYVALALALRTVASRACSPAGSSRRRTLGSARARVLVAGTAFWPWAQKRPLKRPVQALSRLSTFDWTARCCSTGRDVRTKALPVDYVPAGRR